MEIESEEMKLLRVCETEGSNEESKWISLALL